jgi:hypothetical protein
MTGKTVTNRHLTPQEERRQAVYVALQQEVPDHILDVLAEIVANEDWLKYSFKTALEYFSNSFEHGGIGLSETNIRALMNWEHRLETDRFSGRDPYHLAKLQSLRELVRNSLNDKYIILLDRILLRAKSITKKRSVPSKSINSRQKISVPTSDMSLAAKALSKSLTKDEAEELIANLLFNMSQ